MKILSIETSCDETAVSIVEASGGIESPSFFILGNALFSQIEIHKEYGGVFPMVAKREHAKSLPILLEKVLKEAGDSISFDISNDIENTEDVWNKVEKILEREEGLYTGLRKVLEKVKRPEIDLISVTSGPGLEPALWVGISCAKALSILWNIPVVPVNHMEGHITSILVENADQKKIEFPALSVLISGGHTEIVLTNNWGEYEIIGQTVDDAVGEAFDKAARMLGLPYPGGPEISRLAEKAREDNVPQKAKFTRPMLHSHDLNFSFSGLKTAVLYYIRDLNRDLSLEDKMDIAREFEDAVVEVLLKKTEKAIQDNNIKTLIIAGGVIANKKISQEFKKLEEKFGILVKTPTKELSTDNSLMIASATYINSLLNPDFIKENREIKANGNLKLGNSL